jgi:hypothetical protein
MEVYAGAVEVLKIWNMTISLPIPVVVVMMLQIFSYFVESATEANQTVAIVKYIIKRWELIVVKAIQLKLNLTNLQLLPHNAHG